jgi:hypothetical protein
MPVIPELEQDVVLKRKERKREGGREGKKRKEKGMDL